MGYYSSANCSFYLENPERGIHKVNIGEAYALRANRTDRVMPYYSWASKKVSKFVDGTTIVEGALVVNIASIKYLQRLIAGKVEHDEDAALAVVEKNINEITTLFQSEDVSETGQISSNVKHSDILEVARLRQEALKGQTARNVRAAADIKAINDDVMSTEVNLIVEGPDNVEVERIQGVRFTGKSVEMTAGSSMNIKYAFPFVAKTCSI